MLTMWCDSRPSCVRSACIEAYSGSAYHVVRLQAFLREVRMYWGMLRQCYRGRRELHCRHAGKGINRAPFQMVNSGNACVRGHTNRRLQETCFAK
eukprot:1148000-Pelagomonas_calceolata.AAC.8